MRDGSTIESRFQRPSRARPVAFVRAERYPEVGGERSQRLSEQRSRRRTRMGPCESSFSEGPERWVPALTRDLASCPDVDELLVADVDGARARGLAEGARWAFAGDRARRPRSRGCDRSARGRGRAHELHELHALRRGDRRRRRGRRPVRRSPLGADRGSSGAWSGRRGSRPSPASERRRASRTCSSAMPPTCSTGWRRCTSRGSASGQLLRLRGSSTRSSGNSLTTVRRASTTRTAATFGPDSWRARGSWISRRQLGGNASTTCPIPRSRRYRGTFRRSASAPSGGPGARS